VRPSGCYKRREQKRRGTHMARRRMLYLPVMIAAAVLVACAVALSALSEKAEATFPGENGRIAYMDSFSLYTIHPDGSGKTKVTTTTAGGYSIDYSPTGKKITYTDYEGFDGKDTEIYTINVGGGAKTKVTNNNRGDEDSSYSPNGKRIAYAGWDGHDMEIYTIGVNGKNRVRLTNNATNDGFPDYSPNGKKIAAWSEKGQYIYTISVHGGVSLKSWRAPILPTRPTARGSLTRVAASSSGTPRYTPSKSMGGIGPR